MYVCMYICTYRPKLLVELLESSNLQRMKNPYCTRHVLLSVSESQTLLYFVLVHAVKQKLTKAWQF